MTASLLRREQQGWGREQPVLAHQLVPSAVVTGRCAFHCYPEIAPAGFGPAVSGWAVVGSP